jgi:hypothetical protein
MASQKATFTLDDITVNRLREAAERLAMPKSEVVREAIFEFHERIGRLSDRERAQMLRAFDELVTKIPARSPRDVEREIADLRASRKAGGRRSARRSA